MPQSAFLRKLNAIAPGWANLPRTLLAALLLIPSVALHAADWKPVPGHIMTEWAAKVDPNHVLPEYPRPQLVREHWVNLNGLWDYAVTKNADGLGGR